MLNLLEEISIFSLLVNAGDRASAMQAPTRYGVAPG